MLCLGQMCLEKEFPESWSGALVKDTQQTRGYMPMNDPKHKMMKCIFPSSLDSKRNSHMKSIVKDRSEKPLFEEDHDVQWRVSRS